MICRTLYLTLIAVVALGAIPELKAATAHVAKWGAGGSFCGSAQRPCRTLQQGIDQAGTDGQVIVHPGVYVENISISFSGLRMESVAGRFATTVKAADATQPAVRISASRVHFGRRGRGFGVTGGREGILVAAFGTSPAKVRIQGNYLRETFASPVSVYGSRAVIRYNLIRLLRLKSVSGEQVEPDAISCVGCDSSLIANNELVTTRKLKSQNGAGIVATNSSALRVIANSIRGPFSRGISVDRSSLTAMHNAISRTQLAGIAVENSTGNADVLSGNIVLKPGQIGISYESSPEFLSFRGPDLNNNLLIAGRGAGLLIAHDNRSQVLNNTAVQNKVGIAIEPEGANAVLSNSSLYLVRNSTFASSRAGIENRSDRPVEFRDHYFGGGDQAIENPGSVSGNSISTAQITNVETASQL